jgi:hypothetical protein
MRLIDLHPSFLNHVSETEEFWDVSFNEANGIQFLCPECTRRKRNGENIHVHSVICWNPSVPQSVPPNPGRWNMAGTGFDDLSLINGSSSVLLQGECNAHFWIKNGEVVFC